jgi:hypothetical protein
MDGGDGCRQHEMPDLFTRELILLYLRWVVAGKSLRIIPSGIAVPPPLIPVRAGNGPSPRGGAQLAIGRGCAKALDGFSWSIHSPHPPSLHSFIPVKVGSGPSPKGGAQLAIGRGCAKHSLDFSGVFTPPTPQLSPHQSLLAFYWNEQWLIPQQ